jgi:2TM domain
MSEQITLEEYKKAYREIVFAEQRAGFYIHLVVYLIINALLISINLYFVPSVVWFIFPLAGWGVGIVAHYFGAIRFAPQDLEKKEAQVEYTKKSQVPQLTR